MHKMVVPYNSNACENSLVQWNVWIHWLPRENVITMSLVLVGRNFNSVDFLLTFTLYQCNVMTLLNNLSGTGAWLEKLNAILLIVFIEFDEIGSLSQFTKCADVLPHYPVKSRSRGIRVQTLPIAHREQSCRDECQIWGRCDHYNIQSRGYETCYRILR